MAARGEIVNELAGLVQFRICLGDDVIPLLNGGKVLYIRSNFSVGHSPVWSFKETIVVGASINRQGVDQANVWAFRRFNRTHTPVVSRVHIANFEACALARQATGTKR